MIYIVTNASAILAATLAGLLLGMIYALMADRGRAMRLARGGGARLAFLALALLAEFWLAAILAGALILAPPEAGRWTMALGSAVVIWIGFVVPVLLVTHRYRGLPTTAALADCGHWLGVMLIQAVVLQTIGLVAPR